VDHPHDGDEAHGPEDRAIFELTCPRCGARVPLASQSPLDRPPPRETVACPVCGYDIRLVSDPNLA
jgi:hypothetical protein